MASLIAVSRMPEPAHSAAGAATGDCASTPAKATAKTASAKPRSHERNLVCTGSSYQARVRLNRESAEAPGRACGVALAGRVVSFAVSSAPGWLGRPLRQAVRRGSFWRHGSCDPLLLARPSAGRPCTREPATPAARTNRPPEDHAELERQGPKSWGFHSGNAWAYATSTAEPCFVAASITRRRAAGGGRGLFPYAPLNSCPSMRAC